MVARAVPTGLSTPSRVLTGLVAAASGVLGVMLFAAANWAAPRFAWQVSPFVVMTIGAWFLGNCFWAARIARSWSWAHWASGLVYLWGFGVLQSIVLIAYAGKVRTASPVAWLYLGLIALMVLTAVVGVVDVLRLRPSTALSGPPVPAWMRLLVIVFVVFVTYLFAVAMFRPAAATGGHIFPEHLSRFTLRSFGVYYFSLVVGVLAVAWRRTPGPVVGHVEGGLGITVPLLAATLLNLRVFDLSGHPGQWIYLCSYAVALVISVPIVILYRRAERRGAPSAHPGDRGIPAPRGAASAEIVGKPAARLRRR